MTKKLSGRTAVILAFGVLMGSSVLGLSGPSFAGPAEAPPDNAAVTAPANPADTQVAPGDQAAPTNQLSDSDRSAQQDDLRQPVIVTQQSETQAPQAETQQAPRAAPVVAGSQSATWDETSLIGKIFIGFGALLTIASAARMFMA